DLEPAVRRTELGEVAVELGDPAAEIRVLLDDRDVIARLGRLQRGGDAGDAAADDENGPVDLGREHQLSEGGSSPLPTPPRLRRAGKAGARTLVCPASIIASRLTGSAPRTALSTESTRSSEGGSAPLPTPPPRIRCAGKAGARTRVCPASIIASRS